jgi:hypothetical protein
MKYKPHVLLLPPSAFLCKQFLVGLTPNPNAQHMCDPSHVWHGWRAGSAVYPVLYDT